MHKAEDDIKDIMEKEIQEAVNAQDEIVREVLGAGVQYPSGATTNSISSSDTISLVDLRRAIDMLEANENRVYDKVEMCMKHWKKLEKDIGYQDAVEVPARRPIYFLGLSIFIKPYLKKVWLYKDGKRTEARI